METINPPHHPPQMFESINPLPLVSDSVVSYYFATSIFRMTWFLLWLFSAVASRRRGVYCFEMGAMGGGPRLDDFDSILKSKSKWINVKTQPGILLSHPWISNRNRDWNWNRDWKRRKHISTKPAVQTHSNNIYEWQCMASWDHECQQWCCLKHVTRVIRLMRALRTLVNYHEWPRKAVKVLGGSRTTVELNGISCVRYGRL